MQSTQSLTNGSGGGCPPSVTPHSASFRHRSSMDYFRRRIHRSSNRGLTFNDIGKVNSSNLTAIPTISYLLPRTCPPRRVVYVIRKNSNRLINEFGSFPFANETGNSLFGIPVGQVCRVQLAPPTSNVICISNLSNSDFALRGENNVMTNPGIASQVSHQNHALLSRDASGKLESKNISSRNHLICKAKTVPSKKRRLCKPKRVLLPKPIQKCCIHHSDGFDYQSRNDKKSKDSICASISVHTQTVALITARSPGSIRKRKVNNSTSAALRNVDSSVQCDIAGGTKSALTTCPSSPIELFPACTQYDLSEAGLGYNVQPLPTSQPRETRSFGVDTGYRGYPPASSKTSRLPQCFNQSGWNSFLPQSNLNHSAPLRAGLSFCGDKNPGFQHPQQSTTMKHAMVDCRFNGNSEATYNSSACQISPSLFDHQPQAQGVQHHDNVCQTPWGGFVATSYNDVGIGTATKIYEDAAVMASFDGGYSASCLGPVSDQWTNTNPTSFNYGMNIQQEQHNSRFNNQYQQTYLQFGGVQSEEDLQLDVQPSCSDFSPHNRKEVQCFDSSSGQLVVADNLLMDFGTNTPQLSFMDQCTSTMPDLLFRCTSASLTDQLDMLGPSPLGTLCDDEGVGGFGGADLANIETQTEIPFELGAYLTSDDLASRNAFDAILNDTETQTTIDLLGVDIGLSNSSCAGLMETTTQTTLFDSIDTGYASSAETQT